MKKIKYTITFHSYWHCGSGLAAGADVDALVIKDKNGLPYIPGKTIKGLVREALDEILSTKGEKEMDDTYLKTFGYLDEETVEEKKDEKFIKSDTFFSNATMIDKDSIVGKQLQRFLFNSISQTAIGEDGTAKKLSLRKMQVVVPCKLQGEIIDVPDDMADNLLNALRFIKNLGVNRNRGLGRCTIEGKEVS